MDAPIIDMHGIVKRFPIGTGEELEVLHGCCFSKRTRKVFKKNEKSMLQFCNKNSKKKRAFTMG